MSEAKRKKAAIIRVDAILRKERGWIGLAYLVQPSSSNTLLSSEFILRYYRDI